MALSFTRGITIGAAELAVPNTSFHALVDDATINTAATRSNFAQSASIVHVASSAPTSNPTPINGHLWYDNSNNILMEYDGTDWLPNARGTLLTNRSGTTLSAGDVVVIDTGNTQSCTTSTTASDLDVIGVVVSGGIALAKVAVITEGRSAAVTVTGATAIGDYLFQSTTAAEAVSSSTNASGSFARALSSTAGAGSVIAQIGGGALLASGAGSDFTDANSITFTFNTNASGATNYAHGLSVTPSVIHTSWAGNTATIGGGSGMAAIDSGGTIQQSYSGQTHAGTGKSGTGSVVLASEGDNSSNFSTGAVTAVDGTNITITYTANGGSASFNSRVTLLCYG
jgi:hypothetical protein